MGEFARDYAVGQGVRNIEMVPEAERPSFQGYLRDNGKAGTRNYIGVLSTVNCSASVCKFIADKFPDEELASYPNVDGIVAITHGTGCGMADRGEGYATLQRTLWGFAKHANFSSILMIGLGCEVMQIDFLTEAYGIKTGPYFRTMTLQDTGGTRATIQQAHAMIREMLPHANEFARRPIAVSEISLALQCGGSDGYSGITANPALGDRVDLLVQNGGTAILSETPEIYGAEHLLTRRAISQEVADKLLERIRWWEEYCERNGGEMNNNPSPGNKKGGLTTILEKSLGAAAKGGTTNLMGVYKYAEPIDTKRLRLHGHPRLRPGLGHRPGGVGRQHDLLHHRPRLLLRLQADAVDQDRHQHGDVPADGRGHGRQRRRHRRRRGDDPAGRQADLRQGGRGGVGRAEQERGAGHGRQRVRAVADRRGDVRGSNGVCDRRTVTPAIRCSACQRS